MYFYEGRGSAPRCGAKKRERCRNSGTKHGGKAEGSRQVPRLRRKDEGGRQGRIRVPVLRYAYGARRCRGIRRGRRCRGNGSGADGRPRSRTGGKAGGIPQKVLFGVHDRKAGDVRGARVRGFLPRIPHFPRGSLFAAGFFLRVRAPRRVYVRARRGDRHQRRKGVPAPVHHEHGGHRGTGELYRHRQLCAHPHPRVPLQKGAAYRHRYACRRLPDSGRRGAADQPLHKLSAVHAGGRRGDVRAAVVVCTPVQPHQERGGQPHHRSAVQEDLLAAQQVLNEGENIVRAENIGAQGVLIANRGDLYYNGRGV